MIIVLVVLLLGVLGFGVFKVLKWWILRKLTVRVVNLGLLVIPMRFAMEKYMKWMVSAFLEILKWRD